MHEQHFPGRRSGQSSPGLRTFDDSYIGPACMVDQVFRFVFLFDVTSEYLKDYPEARRKKTLGGACNPMEERALLEGDKRHGH